jgi:hypothetical protein
MRTVLGLVVAASVAVAQEPDEVRRVIDQARASNLPASYLEDKVLEAAAKRVPREKLVEAITRLAGHLGACGRLVDEELAAARKKALAVEARRDLVLAMQRAADLRVGDDTLRAVVKGMVAAQAQPDAKALSEAVHLAGVARGVGMSEEQARGVAARAIERRYSPAGMARAAAWILRRREDLGEQFPPEKIWRWMTTGMERTGAIDQAIPYWDSQIRAEYAFTPTPVPVIPSGPNY